MREINTRTHLRFKPDPLEYAQVALYSPDQEEAFKPDFVALIVEEAPLAGCSLIAHAYPGIEVNAECLVKIGELAPVHAQVIWKKPLESDLVRFGLKFFE